MLSSISTILLNALPLILIFIPLPFIWKKVIGKLYLRIVIALSLFYLIYWVLPILIQLNLPPKNLSGGGGNLLGIEYIFVHFINLIAIFSSYPLVVLPFIFFISPFFSFVVVCFKVRKEKEPKAEILKKITYEFNEGILTTIKKDLMKSDWKREREIFKLMLILLPISLYLLQVILDISDLQNFSLSTAQTALGWFLEILFVYIAIFLFSIELLSSSQLAFKGRYFGEKTREQTYKSLTSVGIPISVLSLILFIVEYTESIDIIFFFFAYFIMAAAIFVLFFKVFEPISIFILIKLINWWKNRHTKPTSVNTRNIYYSFIYALIAVFIFSIATVLLSFLYTIIFGDPANVNFIINTAKFNYTSPTLQESLLFDLMIIFDTLTLDILAIAVSSILLFYTLHYIKSRSLGLGLFLVVVIAFSIIMPLFYVNPLIKFAAEEYWLTGQTSYYSLFGTQYFTLRTAAFEAKLSDLLFVLAVPYLYGRYIFSIAFWGYIVFYTSKKYRVKTVLLDDKNLEKVVYSNEKDFPFYRDFKAIKNDSLIVRNKGVEVKSLEQDKEEVQAVLQKLENEVQLCEILTGDDEKDKKLYFVLKYLFTTNQISIYIPEFSYMFERVYKQGLYIIYEDGRGIFDHAFVEGGLQDPGIISGMFSAISSFIKETTKSQQFLKTIDHGDSIVIVEYSSKFFGALFLKGNQTAEIRAQLKEFVQIFEKSYSKHLVDWSGALEPFKNARELVDQAFKED